MPHKAYGKKKKKEGSLLNKLSSQQRKHTMTQINQTTKIKFKEKILKAAREKQQITYKEIPKIGRASCRERV